MRWPRSSAFRVEECGRTHTQSEPSELSADSLLEKNGPPPAPARCISVLMRRLFLCVLASSVGAVTAAAAAEPGRTSFNRDIRPIMSDTCFRCHGPDKNARKAEMRLDIREEAITPTRS